MDTAKAKDFCGQSGCVIAVSGDLLFFCQSRDDSEDLSRYHAFSSDHIVVYIKPEALLACRLGTHGISVLSDPAMAGSSFFLRIIRRSAGAEYNGTGVDAAAAPATDPLDRAVHAVHIP